MIEESVIKSVLEGTDIVRLVGEYVQLKRIGRSVKGLCPFHQEKTPSFHVNAERHAYHCFGCGVGGNAVDFLMRMENLSFPEAVERLAERLGIEVRRSMDNSPVSSSRVREKKGLVGTMKLAQEFFLSSFLSQQGVECRTYAHNRGITDEMVGSFALGFAPESWDGLVDALKRGGASLSDAEKLGLVGERESGGYYAKFRNRLMFPVHNARGEIIAFGGRILTPGDTAKYINSPESEIYTKGEHLYGLYQAKSHIVREQNVILVEGNVDAVMMHGFGFRQTVASMGTALTPKQAQLLYKSLPESGEKTLYIMYDGDNAGRKAMVRALGILMQYDFARILAIELPNGEDPDSFLRTYNAEGLKALMDAAQPLAQWCIRKQCDAILQLAPELRKAGYTDLAQTLSLFANPTVRQHYLGEASRMLGLDVRFLSEELHARKEQVPQRDDRPVPSYETDSTGMVRAETLVAQMDPVECEVARILLIDDERLKDFASLNYFDLFQDPTLRALISDYAQIEDHQNAWTLEQHLAPAQRKLFECLVCRESDVDDKDMDQWFNGALATLTRNWAEAERRKISIDIQQAIRQDDKERIQQLLERNNQLIHTLKDSFEARKYLWELHRN